MEMRLIQTPLEDDVIETLRTGDKLFLNGYIYTARDTAHKRLLDALEKGENLPLSIKGEVIYYCGPSPARPGRVVGACGPTTSSRMDAYTPTLISLGLKGMIGKGKRSQAVRDAIMKYKAVYFGATGGAGALLSRSVLSSEVVAYADLGPEAILKLSVKNMPLFVVDDIYGSDLYDAGRTRYSK
jgi:fumarate hydratase subunit beta